MALNSKQTEWESWSQWFSGMVLIEARLLGQVMVRRRGELGTMSAANKRRLFRNEYYSGKT
jgi:hypothetical protein